jgi:hypothetical protein
MTRPWVELEGQRIIEAIEARRPWALVDASPPSQ